MDARQVWRSIQKAWAAQQATAPALTRHCLADLDHAAPRDRTLTLDCAVMGWVVLAALVRLLHALGPDGFAWVPAGRLSYNFGIIFHALDTRLSHAHGSWHVFVIAGSPTRYIANLRHLQQAQRGYAAGWHVQRSSGIRRGPCAARMAAKKAPTGGA